MKYKIALSMLDGVSASFVMGMKEAGISCEDFFTLDVAEISRYFKNAGINKVILDMAIHRGESELKFLRQHSIKALFLTDDDYPPLLKEIPDAPVVLYVLGQADLTAIPSLSVVGTRRCTSYGLNFCDKFIKELSEVVPGASIVSGLAYGIDAAAHSAALSYGLQTIAVVAHGLDMIYPAAHRDLAKRIIESGGAIVTEYPVSTRPLRSNFLHRNRIIAGLCELTMVVESEVKGGAMSTASSAFSYSRDVVAVPGRVSDVSSSGCNLLIQQQKANIYTSVNDILKLMGWSPNNSGIPQPIQINLFPELSGDSLKIYTFIRQKASPQSIDQIHNGTGIPMPLLMALLTELEFDSIINKLPGSRYELV